MTFPSNLLGGLGGSQAGNATVKLGVDVSGVRQQVRQGVNGIKSELQRGAAEIQGQSKIWSTAFGVIKAAAVTTAVGVVAAMGAGAAASISYESAFAGVIKTVDAAPPVLDRLRQRFKELSTEIPISANELARLGEAAGALGVDVNNIEEFVRVAALIGETTDVSSDQAATSLGQLSNVLNLTADDYEKFASTLVDLGNKGASTESQILQIASRAGAAGHLIGLTTPQILAFSSSVANLGIEVEAGGSALQFLFTNLTLILNDKDKLERLGEVAGMTGAQFKTAFKEDALGALLSFFAGLQAMDSEGRVAALDDLGLAGIRTSRAYLGIAESLDKNLVPALGNADQAWAENNALQIEAQKRFDTTASKIGLLGNKINVLLIDLGDRLLPGIVDIVTWLSDNIPKAADAIASVWNDTLAPALSSMIDGFAELAGSVIRIFTGGAEVEDWGQVVSSVFGGVAGAIGFIAEHLGDIARFFAQVLDNQAIANLARLLAIWVGIRVAFDGIVRAFRGLSGGGGFLRSFASFLTFGAAGRPSVIPGTGGAATGGTGDLNVGEQRAATMLQEAAGSLKLAAEALMRAAATGGLGGGTVPGRVGGNQGGPLTYVGTPGISTSLQGDLAARQRAAATGQMLATQQAAAMAAGAQAATRSRLALRPTLSGVAQAGRNLVGVIGAGIAQGATVVRGAGGLAARGLGAAVGVASRLFWPAMIASFAIDLAAAPIGGFVANNLGLKNLGAELQKDLLGGIGTWVTSWLSGVDVEKIANLGVDQITIGGVTITAVEAAKAGMSRAQIETIFADEMTLTGSVLAIRLARAKLTGTTLPEITLPADLEIPEPLDLGAGGAQVEALLGNILPGSQEFRDYIQRLSEAADQYGLDFAELLDDATKRGLAGNIFDRETLYYISQRIRRAATGDFDTGVKSLRMTVEDALKESYDLKPKDLAALSDTEIERLAILLENNVDGSLDSTINAIIERAKARISGYVPPDQREPVPTAPGQRPFGGLPEGVDTTGPDVLAPFRERVEQAKETWDDFLGYLKESPEGADLAAGAQTLIDDWGTQIAAADTDALKKKIIDKLVPGADTSSPEAIKASWEKVLADYQAAIEATGQDKLVGLAQAYGDMQTAAVKEGSDFSKTEMGATLKQALIDAWNDPKTAPEVKEAIKQALHTGVTAPEVQHGLQEGVTGTVDKSVADGVTRSTPQLTDAGRRLMREVGEGAEKYDLEPSAYAAMQRMLRALTGTTVTSQMVEAGRQIAGYIAQGIDSDTAITRAVTGRLNLAKAMLPDSPVKAGPLRHPFLLNAGREITKQIQQGINSTSLAMPGLDQDALDQGKGNMGSRTFHFDRVYLNGARDEQSLMARLAFLDPTAH